MVHLGTGAVPGDVAQADERHRVGNLQHVSGLLLHQQQSHPPLLELDEQLQNLIHDERGQTQRRLVGNQHLGRMGQQWGQREDLLLATREVASQLVLALSQDGEPITAQLAVVRVGQPELHVLPHGQPAEDTSGLGGQHHAPSGTAVAAQRRNVLPVEPDMTVSGRQKAGSHCASGGLARPVGT